MSFVIEKILRVCSEARTMVIYARNCAIVLVDARKPSITNSTPFSKRIAISATPHPPAKQKHLTPGVTCLSESYVLVAVHLFQSHWSDSADAFSAYSLRKTAVRQILEGTGA